jgi:hypothetical protein
MVWKIHSPTYYGGGYWRTYDPVEIEEMRRAIELDRAICYSCESNSPVPHTWAGTTAEWAATFQCRSLGRWFNPETRKMEGRAHCTCDACF